MEETPFITLEPDHEVDVEIDRVKLEQAMVGGQTVKQYCPTDDGTQRGKLEGFVRVVQNYLRKCVPLDWEDGDKFMHLEEVLRGRSLRAYERVIARPLWANPANRTEARWENFYHAICIEKCHSQANIRDVIYEHLKKAPYKNKDPYDVKERFDEVCEYADTLPGDNPVPNNQAKVVMFYGLFPSTWRSKFAAVPRSITDPAENTTAVAKFFHSLWKAEKKSGNRMDGTPLAKAKRNVQFDEPADKKINKKQKGNQNQNSRNNAQTKSLCRHHLCAGVRKHEWVNCYHNRNGPNYRPDFNHGGRGGGNHRGGRGGGRGGRGGRGNYNNNNNYRGNNNSGGGNNNNGQNNNGNNNGNNNNQYHNDQNNTGSNNGNNNNRNNNGNNGNNNGNGNQQNNAAMFQGQHHFDVVAAPAPRMVVNADGSSRPWNARLDGDDDSLSLFSRSAVGAN